jgi:sigma-E factor negative regulatory protein RseC
MIETRVRVTAAGEGMAWVAASAESGCGACQAQSTCGISGLGKFMSNRRPDLPIGQCDAKAGDELLLSIDEAELVRAGLFAYLLPAVLAVTAAALADTLGVDDLASLAAALAGLGAGLLIARHLAPKPRMRAQTLSPSEARSTS